MVLYKVTKLVAVRVSALTTEVPAWLRVLLLKPYGPPAEPVWNGPPDGRPDLYALTP